MEEGCHKQERAGNLLLRKLAKLGKSFLGKRRVELHGCVPGDRVDLQIVQKDVVEDGLHVSLFHGIGQETVADLFFAGREAGHDVRAELVAEEIGPGSVLLFGKLADFFPGLEASGRLPLVAGKVRFEEGEHAQGVHASRPGHGPEAFLHAKGVPFLELEAEEEQTAKVEKAQRIVALDSLPAEPGELRIVQGAEAVEALHKTGKGRPEAKAEGLVEPFLGVFGVLVAAKAVAGHAAQGKGCHGRILELAGLQLGCVVAPAAHGLGEVEVEMLEQDGGKDLVGLLVGRIGALEGKVRDLHLHEVEAVRAERPGEILVCQDLRYGKRKERRVDGHCVILGKWELSPAAGRWRAFCPSREGAISSRSSGPLRERRTRRKRRRSRGTGPVPPWPRRASRCSRRSGSRGLSCRGTDSSSWERGWR